ncbi:MAG: ABC transporter ATP-binding protein [Cyclobacteriaceae bacterium]|jgi:ABC-2 type transport system ATP-binding protein|nr:ABC transporter ATP-binding protein [Cyclobacteriaceae bacterium]
MLSLQAVHKAYGAHSVLRIPSFHFAPGLHWIKGTNGSGKTTLFKLMAGMLAFEGDVMHQATSLKKQPVAFRKLISYAPAEPMYPAYLSGHQLIDFVRRVRHASKEQTHQLLNVFQAADYAHQPVGGYSSGMLKKISLVMALTGDTSVLLLDEPFVTLDVATVQHVYALMAERLRSGATLLVSTHQPWQPFEGMEVKQVALVDKNLYAE